MENESHTARTTRIIAYLLIGFYGIGLMVIGVTAAVRKDDPSGAWLDLFKSGFLVLGGGLTTIIGYYFGSRGTEEAQQAADSALKHMEEMRTQMAAMKKEADEMREVLENLSSMSPTRDEEALEVADELIPAEEI